MTRYSMRATVPTVVGLRMVDAVQRLMSLGYAVKTVRRASTAVPPGMVASMSPPAGTRMDLGSTVTITISTGV